jgi:hypothetical protein
MGRPTRQPLGSSVLPRKHRIRVLLAVCAHQKLPPPSSPTPASLDYKTPIPPSAQIPPPIVGAPLTPMSFRSTVTLVSLPSSASSPCLALPSSARPHSVTFPHRKSPLWQSERSCVAVPNAIESTSTTG